MRNRRRRRLQEGKEQFTHLTYTGQPLDLKNAELQKGFLYTVVRFGRFMLALLLCTFSLVRNNVPRRVGELEFDSLCLKTL